MHFRIFRRAFTRKIVITEESQIIRPATSNFCVLCRNSPCKMRILLRLASTKSIKNCNAGGCFAVLSEQILCRCKEKMRSNISYCENFICSKCGYLSLKTVWIWLSSVMLLRKIPPKSIKNAFALGCEQFWRSRFFLSQKLFPQGIQAVCPRETLQGWGKSARQNQLGSTPVRLSLYKIRTHPLALAWDVSVFYSFALIAVPSFLTDAMYSRGERFILRLKTLEKYCASG